MQINWPVGADLKPAPTQNHSKKILPLAVRKVSLCLLALFSFAPIAEPRVVNVAVSARSLAQVAHYVAEEKGYYRDEGLEVRLILMSTPIAAQALIAGNVEFTG